MKKIILLIFILIISLSSCEIQYEIPESTMENDTSESMQSEEKVYGEYPVFDYTWKPSSIIWMNGQRTAFATPRGIFLNGSNLFCYSPSTGTITNPCADPLCNLNERDSTCAFAEYGIVGEEPITDGKNLYFRKQEFVENSSRIRCSLVKTDINGLNMKVLYKTENEIVKISLVESDLYFASYSKDTGLALMKYDLKAEKVSSVKINSKELVISDYLPVNGIIYYVQDGSLYRCNKEVTSSEKIIEDFAYRNLLTDGKDIYSITTGVGIYKADLSTGEVSIVYEPPEDAGIDSYFNISDKGITFTLYKKGSYGHGYDAMIAKIYKNSVFEYNLSDGKLYEYPLETLYISMHYIYDNKLFVQERIDYKGTAVRGKWYVTDLNEINFQPLK